MAFAAEFVWEFETLQCLLDSVSDGVHTKVVTIWAFLIDALSMQAKLIPLVQGREIVISKDVTIVGRKQGICDVVIEHPSISKIHCVVARTDGLLFIRDLGSTNGTKVNGQRVLRGAILPGDELAFAKVKFKVFMGPDDAESLNAKERTEVIEPDPMTIDSSEFELLDEDDMVSLIDDED